MQFGDLKLHVIRESLFKLDGGAMFGVVPRPLWEKAAPPDELNRIELACNLLLIETPTGRVLIDTGMGPRWTEKERDRFELRSLVSHERVLESIGLRNEDVDAVIVSHMHFDHMGGAVVERDGMLMPAFPNANVYVQKGEYALAKSVNARGRASYRADDYSALQRDGKLKIVDGHCEVLPGIWVFVTGGHTSHHQIVKFTSGGKTGVFLGDIVPTRCHCDPPWVMGYDHFPLETCDAKNLYLDEAAREGWLVVLDHEPGVPWGHIKKNAKGKFEMEPLGEETLAPHVVAR